MPDLLAGTTILALDTPPAVFARQGAALVLTSADFEPTDPPCAATFVAPTTGRVLITYWVRWDAAAVSDQMEADVNVWQGSDDTGTEVHAANSVTGGIDAESNSSDSTVHNNAPSWRYVDGLTAGDTFYVELHIHTGGQQFDIEDQTFLVQPLT